MKVAVLGANSNPERYSYKAVSLLQEYGHEVIPVHPTEKSVLNIPCVPSLKEVKNVNTISVYVNKNISSKLSQEFLSAKPKRVIFNPGAENPELEKILENAGIEIVEGCTLVMLRTKQF